MSATMERLTPARLRKPSLAEATMHGGWTLFVESFKRYALSKRSLVLALLFAIPGAIIVLIRSLARDDGGPHGPHGPTWNQVQEFGVILSFAPTVLLSFAAMLNATGLIQDEIEEQTLTYLLLRPTPRWMIYLAKLLAATLATVLLACVLHAASYICLYAGTERFGEVMRTAMPASMGALALTAVAYSAVFGLIGVTLKRSLVVGVLYIIIFEGILASIPFNFRSYTIVYYFRVLCNYWLTLPTGAWGLPTTPDAMPTASSAVTILLGTATVFAAAGAIYTQRKEFRMKTPAGA